MGLEKLGFEVSSENNSEKSFKQKRVEKSFIRLHVFNLVACKSLVSSEFGLKVLGEYTLSNFLCASRSANHILDPDVVTARLNLLSSLTI